MRFNKHKAATELLRNFHRVDPAILPNEEKKAKIMQWLECPENEHNLLMYAALSGDGRAVLTVLNELFQFELAFIKQYFDLTNHEEKTFFDLFEQFIKPEKLVKSKQEDTSLEKAKSIVNDIIKIIDETQESLQSPELFRKAILDQAARPEEQNGGLGLIFSEDINSLAVKENPDVYDPLIQMLENVDKVNLIAFCDSLNKHLNKQALYQDTMDLIKDKKIERSVDENKNYTGPLNSKAPKYHRYTYNIRENPPSLDIAREILKGKTLFYSYMRISNFASELDQQGDLFADLVAPEQADKVFELVALFKQKQQQYQKAKMPQESNELVESQEIEFGQNSNILMPSQGQKNSSKANIPPQSDSKKKDDCLVM